MGTLPGKNGNSAPQSGRKFCTVLSRQMERVGICQAIIMPPEPRPAPVLAAMQTGGSSRAAHLSHLLHGDLGSTGALSRGGSCAGAGQGSGPAAPGRARLWQHSLDHLGNGDLGVLLEGVHHQAVAADVVHALQVTRVGRVTCPTPLLGIPPSSARPRLAQRAARHWAPQQTPETCAPPSPPPLSSSLRGLAARSYLADVTGPGSLLLPGRCHEDDSER